MKLEKNTSSDSDEKEKDQEKESRVCRKIWSQIREKNKECCLKNRKGLESDLRVSRMQEDGTKKRKFWNLEMQEMWEEIYRRSIQASF